MAHPAFDVVAVAIDVGQGTGLDALRDVALSAGATRCHVVDRVEALAAAVCWPALRAGALGEPGEPVLTALSMPAVAEATAEICRHEHATSVAVWADEPRDRQRLRALLRDAAPALGLVSVPSSAATGPSGNLWARVASGPGAEASAAGRGSADLAIGFERGHPVALSGVAMTPAELVDSLATIGRAHGVGTWTAAGDGGSWTVQAPAALILQRAFEALTARRFDARTGEMAAAIASAYAAVVRDGAWFSPVRAGMDAFVDRVLEPATGEVRLRVVDGRIEVEDK